MKKTVVLIGMLIGFTGFSQDKMATNGDALKLVKMQSSGTFKVMLQPLVKMIPEKNQDAFMEEVKSQMPELYQKIAAVYKDTFTPKEIDKMMEFYKSPIGQKILEKMPEVSKKSMQIGRTWGMSLQPIMAKYQN